MKASNVFLLGVVGIGLYYVWKLSQAAAGGVSAAASAASSAANALSCGIATIWTSLTQQPCMSINGNVIFPGGAEAAVSTLPIATDANGNVYVQYQGGVYQLGQSDSNGNWPATQVS